MKKKEDKGKKKEKKKVKFVTAGISILIAAAVFLIIFSILIYKTTAHGPMIDLAARIVPYPLAAVDGFHFVTIRDVQENLSSVEQFYENQDFGSIGVRVDFSTANGKKRLKLKEKEIINKMIEDLAIELLAKERGIRLTKNMVNETVERKIKEVGEKGDIEKNLEILYGWNLKDFKEKIVMPGMYKAELKKDVEENDLANSTKEAKEKIERLKSDLDSGKDFDSVVNENSSEEQDRNGNLGWFKRDYVISDLQGTVFDLEKGKISDIIESELGFHIVKVLDKKSEEGVEMIEVAQIFVAKKTFGEWLEERMSEMKIRIFARDYQWNKEDVRCDFSNESMREFEKVLAN